MILYGILAFLFGFLCFLVGPMTVAPLLSRERRQALGDWYTKMAMSAADRATIVVRKHGDLDLVTMSYDARKGAEEIELDGETEHISDDFGVLGWLHNRQFGIADEASTTFTSTLWAEFAEVFGRLRREGRLERELSSDGGESSSVSKLVCDIIPMNPQSRLVWPGSTIQTVAGDRDPTDGETAYEQTEKSQEGFHRKVGLGDIMAIVTAFVAGGLLVWFVVWMGSGSGGGVDPSTIPMFVGGGL